MKIFINSINKEPPGDIDEFIDEELSPFQYCLEELRRFIDGTIVLDFGEGKKIVLYIYPDLTVCFEEIVESVVHAKNGDADENIWFCEQGSDFYISYSIKKGSVFITFKKGTKTGFPNNEMADFFVEVNRNNYIEEWENLFKSIAGLFADKLNKKIDCPV